MTPNRLATETSPYLLQHADNPVDWFPWGDEALEAAVERDVPILLSVGYAACHWCHVMAHESFEDAATAGIMNANFVNIKVDREERPDIDGIYMDAVQAMTGRGGWPMTVFLTPSGEPFYSGTYFPPQPHHGLPSFTQVLDGISRAWTEERDDLTARAATVIDHLRSRSFSGETLPGVEALESAVTSLASTYDAAWGGFGGAPKFPPSMSLDLLLRLHQRGNDAALPMVDGTLDRMGRGGIFDHVGGGFHRYSVDGQWHVPHFEKMLYDNALLLTAYTRAWLVTRSPAYRTVIERTADFMIRELQQPDGGFASSLDADSEGAEGTFYVWDHATLREHASDHVVTHLGAVPEGNWEGTNVLWMPVDAQANAARFDMTPEALEEETNAALAALFFARSARVRPGIDDKVLAAWNGLAIGAMAEAGAALAEPRFTQAAVQAAGFINDSLRIEGRLARSWRDGRTGGPGFLEDHASMATGLLLLYETTGDEHWFTQARELGDAIISLFVDPDAPGLFQVGSDASQPVYRPKDLIDGATPSGNSDAAIALLRLGLFTGESGYREAAMSALRGVAEPIALHPGGFAQALCALELSLADPIELALIGDAEDATLHAMHTLVMERYLPNRAIALGDPARPSGIPLLHNRPLVNGQAAAYACRGFVCDAPVTSAPALADALDQRST